MKNIKEYTVVRSARKSAAVEVSRDGKVIIRVPFGFTDKMADKLAERNKDWIEKKLEAVSERIEAEKAAFADEKALERAAAQYIPERVAYFAKVMGLYPASVKITGAKTRFGSCSGKNAICFSRRLMAYPKEAVDYVIVHELAHIKYKNHSKAFYRLVEKYMPDYKRRKAMLYLPAHSGE